MKRHLNYVEPKRSPIGHYLQRIAISSPKKNRADARLLGLEIAKCGVMKHKPLVPLAIIDMVTQIYGRSALATSVRNYGEQMSNGLLKSLLGEEMAIAIERDETRFANGHWENVAWANEFWFRNSPLRLLHSLHLPREEANLGMVAFAESPAKLMADKFTVMKPGRYLSRFFSDKMEESTIKKWADKVAAAGIPLSPLQFIEHDDAHGWVRVYKDGCYSCMKGDEAVQVYAHDKSVLRLAYQMRGTEIVTRAIVREDTEPKQYIRAYPNTTNDECQKLHTAMVSALEAAGYEHGNLRGVLLDSIEYEGDSDRYVCPYLDSGNRGSYVYLTVVRVDGRECLRVGNSGMDGQQQDGYVSEENMQTCANCGDSMHEDESAYIESCDRTVCESCRDNYYTSAIGRGGHEDWHSNDDCIYCEINDHHYVERYASENGIYLCEVSGDWYEEGDMVSTSRGMVHTDNAVELAVEDSDGNSWAAESDTVTTHDGRVIHENDAVMRTVYFHKDDDIENDQTPVVAAQQVA